MGKTKNKDRESVVAKAIGGDKRAFGKLCEMDAPVVLYSCIRLMGNLQDGEDAAQEVFIQIQKNIHTVTKPEVYISWSKQVILHVCRNMRRKKMNQPEPFPLEDFSDLYTEDDAAVLPEEYIYNKEKRSELMKCVDALPFQTRTCVVMYYFNEMKISEVAEELEVTEGTVKTHLYLGREKIRKAIKELDAGAYLHSATLLPMGAVSLVMQQDMLHTITPALVQQCLQPFGASLSKVLLPVAKEVFLSLACTAAVTASAAMGASYFASQSPVPIRQPENVPQHFQVQPGADGLEDTATESGAAEPGAVPPGPTPSGPGRDTPDTDTSAPPPSAAPQETENTALSAAPEEYTRAPEPPSPPPVPSPPVPSPPAALATGLEGRVSLKTTGTAGGETAFGGLHYVTLEKDGVQLGLAMVDENGHFSFQDLLLAENGSYTLRLHSLHNYGPDFAQENPDGALTVELVPGETLTLEAPLYVVDEQPPVVAVLLQDEQGAPCVANPAGAQISAQDATPVTISWALQSAEGEKMAGGKTARIEADVFQALPNGRYTLAVTAADKTGNQARTNKTFYILGRG